MICSRRRGSARDANSRMNGSELSCPANCTSGSPSGNWRGWTTSACSGFQEMMSRTPADRRIESPWCWINYLLLLSYSCMAGSEKAASDAPPFEELPAQHRIAVGERPRRLVVLQAARVHLQLGV